MAPTPSDTGDRAVRNVILVAGHDFKTFDVIFDEAALARISRLLARNEHEQGGLRFHLFSAGRGLVAESILIDQSYPPTKAGDPRKLEQGPFWQRVERRFVAPARSDYDRGFDERLFLTFQRAEEDNTTHLERVMSMLDVYDYLYSFRENADRVSPGSPRAYDCILELSVFTHASVDSVLLLNSRAARGTGSKRGPRDRDGRAEDVKTYPAGRLDFWKKAGSVFDPARGRVRLWGGAGLSSDLFYLALLSQTVGSPAYLSKRGYMRLSAYRSLDPAKQMSDGDPIVITDSVARDELRRRDIDPDALTFGQVKSLAEGALRSSYARAIADALGVVTQAAMPGVLTEIHGGEMQVPKALDEVAQFYEVHLGVEAEPEHPRYGLLRPVAASRRQ